MKNLWNKFYFKNFRNIGLDREEELLLNNYYENSKNKFGDLIILIGANNTGKSNVLDGLEKFANCKIDLLRDKTNLDFGESFENITLRWKGYESEYTNTLNNISFTDKNKISNLKKARNIYLEALGKNNDPSFEKVKKLDDKKFTELITHCYYYFNSNYPHNWHNQNIFCYDDFDVVYIPNLDYKELVDMVVDKSIQIPFKVVRYNENTGINNNMLKCSINSTSLSNNSLFSFIFKKIGYDSKNIVECNKLAIDQTNKGLLVKQAKEINKKIQQIVSKEFNKLYTFGNTKYQFRIDMEYDNIYLTIWENKDSITLEYQSTGFKWFFSLYFNEILDSLQPGDILFIDEPGVYLHASGQAELRVFLKELAKEKNITIIITTHSPFMIDLDNLDEIRTISKENGFVRIDNNFAVLNTSNKKDDGEGGINVLEKIKRALTISNNVLFDEDEKLFFVEGITDYNYLTVMKRLFKNDDGIEIYKNLHFLPIGGLGDSKHHDDTIKNILNFWKFNPIILTDSDGDNGNAKKFKNVAENNYKGRITVINLDEVDKSFKTSIEDLFSENDRKKYDIKNNKECKTSNRSCAFKKYINEFEFDTNTLNNFQKLFEYLKII